MYCVTVRSLGAGSVAVTIVHNRTFPPLVFDVAAELFKRERGSERSTCVVLRRRACVCVHMFTVFPNM